MFPELDLWSEDDVSQFDTIEHIWVQNISLILVLVPGIVKVL